MSQHPDFYYNVNSASQHISFSSLMTGEFIMTTRNQPYYPSTESASIIWLTHFALKLAACAEQLKLSAEEVAATLSDIKFYVWYITTYYPAVQQAGLEATAYKNTLANDATNALRPLPVMASYEDTPAVRPSGILSRLFNLIQRIKLSPGYSTAIGQDLGIIGTQTVDTHDYPGMTLEIQRNETQEYVVVKFTKYQHDAVTIESRRNNGKWENMGISLKKPWLDMRPMLMAGVPEVREYRIRWYNDATTSGEFSPVQKINVGP